jgi:hypothetical protein
VTDQAAYEARYRQVQAGFAATRRDRQGVFAARMDGLRADNPGLLEAAKVDLDGWDLLMRGEQELLGAVVRRPPDPAAPYIERPKGHVVHFDDEGLRIMVFGRPYGKMRVVAEDVIPFSEVDPAETAPGNALERHMVARMLVQVVADGSNRRMRNFVDDYERRLLGFASRLTAPNVPVRRGG